MIIIYFIIAFLGGVSIVISRMLNAILGQKLGVFQGVFFNFLSGLIFSFFLFFVMFLIGHSTLIGVEFTGFPIYFYFGGLFGIAITGLSNHFVPKISAFYFTLFMFTGQLVTSMFLDYVLYSDFSITKVTGAFLVIFGLSLNLKADKNKLDKTNVN